MPLVTDEQSVKKPSEFLKLENENIVVIKSNVYIVNTHWLNKFRRTVLCIGDNCQFCANSLPIRHEFHYVARVNGVDGFLRLPASVFFDMNQIEKMTKKDKRHFSWLVIKQGQGRETKYTTSKDEAIKSDESELPANNDKLSKVMKSYESSLADNYRQFVKVWKKEDDEVVNQDGQSESDTQEEA